MRPSGAALLVALAAASAAGASEVPGQEPAVSEAAGAEAESEWSVSLVTSLYLQEEDDFLMPILGADRGSLHLEGRYQYEDLKTGSLWVGWTFEAGTSLRLAATPMAGVVFGQTSGAAPGLELTVSWKSLELYSESEYLFDSESEEGDFFYVWTELGWQALPWLRLGLAAQRTRLYESELAIERGLFTAVSHGPVELIAYAFNLDGDEPFAILALAVDF
jgi:hypothetical protein